MARLRFSSDATQARNDCSQPFAIASRFSSMSSCRRFFGLKTVLSWLIQPMHQRASGPRGAASMSS